MLKYWRYNPCNKTRKTRKKIISTTIGNTHLVNFSI